MEEYGIQQLTFGVAIENEKQIGEFPRFGCEFCTHPTHPTHPRRELCADDTLLLLSSDERKGVLMRFRNEYDFDYFTSSILYTKFIGSSSSNSMSIVTYGVGSQQESRNL